VGVVLEIDGRRYDGWMEASFVRSIRQVASVFSLAVTERWTGQEQRWTIQPGQACRLTSADLPLVTGFVTRYEPGFSASDRQVRIAGASRTVDIADSSIVVPGGQFAGYRLDAIARALLAPYSLHLDLKMPDVGAAFSAPAVTPGEEVAAFLTRLAADRGGLLYDNTAGNPVIGKPATGRAVSGLVQGRNVLSGHATLSAEARFSEYIFRGQALETDSFSGPPALSGEARARDAGVTRYRPRVSVPSGDQTGDSLATRAAHERDRRIADGVSATVTVQGWHQADGSLWHPNDIVPVSIPALGIERDMLIETVTGTLTRATGTLTRLTLVVPEAVDTTALRSANVDGGINGVSWQGLIPNQ
jgi:prophage tail gpP-like protein